MNRKNTPNRRGFVLLLTIGLIALVGLILAGVAQRSLSMSLDTMDAADQLQRRWARRSLEHSLLRRAAAILGNKYDPSSSEDEHVFAAPRLVANVVLGDYTCRVTLCDEDAKINLNTIHHERNREEVASVLLQFAGETRLPIQLRPYLTSKSERELPAYDSWGQVFSLHTREGNAASTDLLSAATAQITCWGRGRLNLRLASDDAVRIIASLALTTKEVDQLLEAREKNPQDKSSEWISSLRLTEKSQEKLAKLCVDESHCFSVSIQMTSARRSWYALIVSEMNADRAATTKNYLW